LDLKLYLASCHDVTKVVLPWCHLRPRGRAAAGGGGRRRAAAGGGGEVVVSSLTYLRCVHR
jgi:hypothetical protein